MNFIGIDVRELELSVFFVWGKLFYLLAYMTWVLWMWRTNKVRGAWMPLSLALLCWFLVTYPLQRSYGLDAGTDRLRNLWWCATAAAGNPPWESGVVHQWNLEPTWSFLVATLSFFNPARVMTVYSFLPALAIAALGLALGFTFYNPPRIDIDEQPSRRRARALWVTFFVLLAPTGPLDFLGPYRGFWDRTFLLKPNHVLAVALIPLVVWLLAGKEDKRRWLAASIVLAALGWMFIIPWALVCWGVVLYGIGQAVQGRPRWGTSAIRLAVILLVSLVLLSPLLFYLIQHFPILNFEPRAMANPQVSVWGDGPSTTHSLFFLVTLDLGLNFFLAVYGMAAAWRSRDRLQQIWLGLAAGGYSAWAFNAVLLSMGQARGSDELYYFVVLNTAVFAALGLERLIHAAARRFPLSRTRWTAATALLWFPLTIGWWWDPPRTNPHFRLGLEPIPAELVSLGHWLQDHSRGSDIVLAGYETAEWIPAVAGRRVLRTGMPRPGTDAHRDERALLFPQDLEEGRQALERTEIRYIVLDRYLRAEHGMEKDHLDRHPLFALVQVVGPFTIYRASETPGRKP